MGFLLDAGQGPPLRSVHGKKAVVLLPVFLEITDGLKCRVMRDAGEESVLRRIRHEASFLRGRPRFPDGLRLGERVLLALWPKQWAA